MSSKPLSVNAQARKVLRSHGITRDMLTETNELWQRFLCDALQKRQLHPSDGSVLTPALDRKEVYSARVVAICLAPSLAEGLFGVKFNGTFATKELPYGLLGTETCTKLRSITIDLLLAFLERTDLSQEVRWAYYQHMVELMGILPQKSPELETLYQAYPLLDPNVFSVERSSICDSSGYRNYERLLFSYAPLAIKLRADAWMQEVVVREESGQSTPRRYWERALDWYLRAVYAALGNLSCKVPYEASLLAGQFDFLLQQDIGARMLFDPGMVGKLFATLEQDKKAEGHLVLRRRLARRVMTEGSFRPYQHSVYQRMGLERMIACLRDSTQPSDQAFVAQLSEIAEQMAEVTDADRTAHNAPAIAEEARNAQVMGHLRQMKQ